MKAFFILIALALLAIATHQFLTPRPTLPDTTTDVSIPTNEPTTTSTVQTSDLITIEAPITDATIPNPVTVSGEARGYWFFEASAPVTITNWDGLIIGEGYITAADDWMTEDFVPFTGTIDYNLPTDSYSATGTIIFRRSNPSDLPENDATVEIPVILTASST